MLVGEASDLEVYPGLRDALGVQPRHGPVRLPGHPEPGVHQESDLLVLAPDGLGEGVDDERTVVADHLHHGVARRPAVRLHGGRERPHQCLPGPPLLRQRPVAQHDPAEVLGLALHEVLGEDMAVVQVEELGRDPRIRPEVRGGLGEDGTTVFLQHAHDVPLRSAGAQGGLAHPEHGGQSQPRRGFRRKGQGRRESSRRPGGRSG